MSHSFDLMSPPFPLVVEVNYRQAEALRRTQQQRLATMATSRPEGGPVRFGRQVAHAAGAIDRVTSLRVGWSKLAPSRAAVAVRDQPIAAPPQAA